MPPQRHASSLSMVHGDALETIYSKIPIIVRQTANEQRSEAGELVRFVPHVWAWMTSRGLTMGTELYKRHFLSWGDEKIRWLLFVRAWRWRGTTPSRELLGWTRLTGWDGSGLIIYSENVKDLYFYWKRHLRHEYLGFGYTMWHLKFQTFLIKQDIFCASIQSVCDKYFLCRIRYVH